MSASLLAGVTAPAGATTYRIDKWWSNRNGDWASKDWSTRSRARQTLLFKTCRITNYDYPYTDKVQIQLIEEREYLPDAIRDRFTYHCNNTSQRLRSSVTNSTTFHFDYESAADWPSTSGTMSVYHS